MMGEEAAAAVPVDLGKSSANDNRYDSSQLIIPPGSYSLTRPPEPQRSYSSPVPVDQLTMAQIQLCAATAAATYEVCNESSEVHQPTQPRSSSSVPSLQRDRTNSLSLPRVQGRFEVVDIPGSNPMEFSMQVMTSPKSVTVLTESCISAPVSAKSTTRAGRFEVCDLGATTSSTITTQPQDSTTASDCSNTSSKSTSPSQSNLSSGPSTQADIDPTSLKRIVSVSNVSRRKVAGRFEVTDISLEPTLTPTTDKPRFSRNPSMDDEHQSFSTNSRRLGLDDRLTSVGSGDLFAALQRRFNILLAENERLRSENTKLSRELARLRLQHRQENVPR